MSVYLAQVLLRPYIRPFLILDIGLKRQLKSASVFSFLFLFQSVITNLRPLLGMVHGNPLPGFFFSL